MKQSILMSFFAASSLNVDVALRKIGKLQQVLHKLGHAVYLFKMTFNFLFFFRVFISSQLAFQSCLQNGQWGTKLVRSIA